ncbi:MAG TPA: methyltransferase domain-containing protein, partial [Anaeromyxobacteraceae bacterium]|nr:methyltransferase domain-containing protein [Anaeromyxobacteraceae bacterium]
SAESLARAEARARQAAVGNATFERADIFDLPFPAESFDHVFVCFVLEHLADPGRALACLRSRLRPGGSITVIEGDHGSAFFYPNGAAARRTIQCLIEMQARTRGDALIGRRLFPLLSAAGFSAVSASPRMVCADGSRPEWVEGFVQKTFIAMVEGARDRVLALGLVEPGDWQQGVEELRRTAEPDGVFWYTFIKAVGVR